MKLCFNLYFYISFAQFIAMMRWYSFILHTNRSLQQRQTMLSSHFSYKQHLVRRWAPACSNSRSTTPTKRFTKFCRYSVSSTVHKDNKQAFACGAFVTEKKCKSSCKYMNDQVLALPATLRCIFVAGPPFKPEITSGTPLNTSINSAHFSSFPICTK